MEEISVNGENYVKASVLAKNFGYTPDYLGQLCRGEQVKCTLVGRSWYVNEESLREHRKGRYRSSSAKSKEQLRKTIEDQSSVFVQAKSSSALKYEADEEELFPALKKVEENNPVNRDGDAVALNVATNKPLTVDSSEERPNIAIRREAQVRRPTPVLRTIPDLRPIVSPIQPRSVIRPRKSEVAQSRVSPAVTLAIFVGILLVESALLFGVLGLEKRLIIADSNQAMILYGFDSDKVFNSVKETFNK